MKLLNRFQQTCVIALTTLSLVVGPCPIVHGQTTKSAKAGETTVDGGWPRGYTTPLGAAVVVYQPQIARWENQQHMTAYAAVSYLAKEGDETALGTIKIEADTKVAVDERLVSFASLKIAEVNFPSLQKDQTRDMVTEITKAIPEEDRVIALDRVLAAIDTSQIAPKNVEGVKADPPVVFYSDAPALLVIFDGEPIWSSIQNSALRFAVNTNWDVFQDGETGPFYLRNEGSWFKATDLKGAWSPAGTLPDSFAKLPDGDWKDVKEALPGKPTPAKDVPAVFVSNGPAEMILTKGRPSFEAVTGTSLLWVDNTESDVFRLGKEGPFYYLVAGRWFASIDLAGPWSFTTPDLPEDFKRIPADHPRARVLASVPGSPAAMEAVLLAQIPQSARVKISEVKAPEVVYQDAPKFESIADTSMQMAVNTDKSIIKVGDLYYMCYQGVWFMSASATGPWTVTTSVPGEIYTIPPSSPAHNVTYVTVVEDDDDEWAEFVCAAGYTGLMIAWGCAVWGTGYYYPPYVWRGALYPVYYPRPVTYGCAAAYNPWTGRYGYAAGVYGPYGGAGAAAVYNPRTGTYARGGVAYGPYGAQGAAQAWNPRTNTYAQTRQGSNVYGSWGSTYVQRGDDWASTKRYTNNATGNTTRVIRTDEGAAVVRRGGPNGPSFVAGGEGGNLYAGQDGNVYQKRNNGDWAQLSGGQPKAGETPTLKAKGTKTTTNAAPQNPAVNRTPQGRTPAQVGAGTAQTGQIQQSMAQQLNRDSVARQAGAQRTQDFGNFQNSQAGGGANLNNRGANVGAGASAGANIGGGGRGGGNLGGGGLGGGGRGGGGRGGRR
jgi:hypothetical protein